MKFAFLGVPCAELQSDGLRSRSHWICVKREPEFQTVFPSPRFWKKSVSSAVAPVMAKLAPCAKLAFLALDGGSSGRPNSCAAGAEGQNPSNSEHMHLPRTHAREMLEKPRIGEIYR